VVIGCGLLVIVLIVGVVLVIRIIGNK